MIDETAKFCGIFSVTRTHGELGSDILEFLNRPPEIPPEKTVSFVLDNELIVPDEIKEFKPIIHKNL